MNSQKKGIVALLAVIITLVMGVLSFISVRFFFGATKIIGFVSMATGLPTEVPPPKNPRALVAINKQRTRKFLPNLYDYRIPRPQLRDFN